MNLVVAPARLQVTCALWVELIPVPEQNAMI